jgi:hypothetical protein
VHLDQGRLVDGGQRRKWARTEGAGGVDQQVQTAGVVDRPGERGAVSRVGDVAGDGGTVGRSAVAARRARASRASVITCQPRSSRAFTSARPRPRDPPVTRATGMAGAVVCVIMVTTVELEVKFKSRAIRRDPTGVVQGAI